MEDADPASLGTHSPQSEPDVLLLGPPLRVDEAFLARLPASIGAIATYSVGFDHIDLDAVRARGLALFDTPSGSLQCRGVIRRHERLVNHIAVIDELREAGGHRIHNEGLASSPGGEAFSFTPARTAPGWTRSAT